MYDAGCQAVPHLERDCPGLLEDRGKPSRLGDDGAGGENDEGHEGAGSIPRVSIPSLAYLGSDGNTSTVQVPSCSLPVEPERTSDDDVYALKSAPLPKLCVQSQLNLHDLLFASSDQLGTAEKVNRSAVTNVAAALWREGVRILSWFEMLVFTYHWHRQAAEDGSSRSVLGTAGWTLQLAAVVNVGGRGPVQEEVSAETVDSFSNEECAKSLRALLVVAVGARGGKVPSLPELGGRNVLVDSNTCDLFATQVAGLRAYAQVSECLCR